MTTLALIASLLALALLASWCLAALVSPMLGRVPARLVPLTVAAVLALGAALALAAIVPPHGSGCHCQVDAASVVHLCAFHPERALPVLPFALAALGVMLVRPALAARRLARTRRATRAMLMRSDVMAAEPRLALTDVPIRNALAVRSRGGLVLADRAWWNALEAWEQRAVLAHEGEHLRRRDPLVLALLSLGASFLPPWLASLPARWRLRAEQAADAAAAGEIGDAAAVAALLVRQHRDMAPGFAELPALANACSLEARVEALLEHRFAGNERAPRLVLPVIAAATAIVSLAWMLAPAVHDLTEALIAWMR